MAKITTIKCPHCNEKIELPDDPRIGELKEAIEKQEKLIGRLVEKLEQQPSDPPKKKKTETVVHKGPVFSIEETVEVDDDD